GRIFDADTGRFMQADPFVQAPNNLQNYNAYSYVLNNPLSYTDPSGYLFKKLGKFVKKHWRSIAAIAAAYYTFGLVEGMLLNSGGMCAFALTSGQMMVAGAASGFVGGVIGSGTLKGGLTGAATGAAFAGIGSMFDGTGGSFWKTGGAGHLGAHALTGGILADVQGGNFGHGFWSAGLTKAANVNGIVGTQQGVEWTTIRVATAAVIGGTISEITGGKFSNGAATAAFGQAFNGEKYAQKVEARNAMFEKVIKKHKEQSLIGYNQGHEELSVAGYIADYEERFLFSETEKYFSHLGPEQTGQDGTYALENTAGGARGKYAVRSAIPGVDNYTVVEKIIATSYSGKAVLSYEKFWQAESFAYGVHASDYNAIPVFVISSDRQLFRFMHGQKTLSWSNVDDFK
ncbi:RHS repeat-associated core domain-containing protein, partial [Pseudoalteromonas luteoviolacea]|uniref:RHS repeat-associated core domain-containing protein n=1 Tax=Pseudoalteromonas luteoviolacea TaxID=43657 RepID=UPI000AB63A3D